MTHAALRIIHEEHAALSAMLRSILLLLAQHRRQGTSPDFATLRAMLFYVDEFPEKLHHQKESELLFPRMRARTTEAGEVLDRLDQDHARGERAIRDLEHALLAFEMMGEARREAFERTAQRYVDFYVAQMSLEEKQVLPLAAAKLLRSKTPATCPSPREFRFSHRRPRRRSRHHPAAGQLPARAWLSRHAAA